MSQLNDLFINWQPKSLFNIPILNHEGKKPLDL